MIVMAEEKELTSTEFSQAVNKVMDVPGTSVFVDGSQASYYRDIGAVEYLGGSENIFLSFVSEASVNDKSFVFSYGNEKERHSMTFTRTVNVDLGKEVIYVDSTID